MNDFVQQALLLRGGLEGGEKVLRTVVASMGLAGSDRTSRPKGEQATGDLHLDVARDLCDMCVDCRGEGHGMIDHGNRRRIGVTSQGKQNILDSHRTLRCCQRPSYLPRSKVNLIYRR